MVDGLHHGLEPGGVEHGHHLHLRLAFHAQFERLHLEDVGHVVGMAQLNCLWTASCSCQSYEMIGKWRWPQDTPIEVAMIMIAAAIVMMTLNMKWSGFGQWIPEEKGKRRTDDGDPQTI